MNMNVLRKDAEKGKPRRSAACNAFLTGRTQGT